jgi:NADPH-dependent curcumin reductase
VLNSEWILIRRPEGNVSASDLALVERPVPALRDGQLLVRILFLSLDPTNRLWMSDRDQYLPPVRIGDVMRGVTLGVVEEGRSDRFARGDVVQPARGGWQRYCIADATAAAPVRVLPGVPLAAHLSVLGTTGLTAYFGLLEIGQPRAGETLVIGIAGGTAKCAWIVDELGFDGAIDYKAQEIGPMLDRLCPDGVDIDFENVGGPIMEAVFNRLNRNGRLALCGMISAYNSEAPMSGPTDFGRILMNRLTVRGFIVSDHLPRAKEALKELGNWIAEGRLKWKDHIVEGLENAPDALQRLFSGAHDGKLMVRVSPED